jgi:hypothetical protein
MRAVEQIVEGKVEERERLGAKRPGGGAGVRLAAVNGNDGIQRGLLLTP